MYISKNYGKFMYGSILLGNFFSASIFSLQAPFFPSEAEKKGVTPTQYGFVFAVYELVFIVTSPLVGAYVNRIGVRMCVCAGILITSITVVMFGSLTFVESGQTFFALAVVIRIFAALGQSAYSISTITVVASVYPDSMAVKISIAEMFFGAGMTSGPAFGGFLFALGGFLLPFVTVGVITLAVGVLSIVLIPSTSSVPKTNNSPTNLTLASLKLPRVWAALACVFSCSLTIGFLLPTLEPLVRPFRLSPELVGLIFMVVPVFSTLHSPIFGKLMDKSLDQRIILWLGLLSKIVSFILIGTLPIFKIKPSLAIIIIGLIFQGIGNSALINAGIIEVICSASEGLKESKDTISPTCMGLFNSAFSSGCFLGSMFGGSALDTIGFKWATFVIVVFNLVLICAVSAMLPCKKIKGIQSEETEKLIEK